MTKKVHISKKETRWRKENILYIREGADESMVMPILVTLLDEEADFNILYTLSPCQSTQ